MSDLAQMSVSIEGDAESDEIELASLTADLRRGLQQLDVESVDLIRGNDVPAGSKPVDAIALGHLAVALSPAVLGGAVAFLRQWLVGRQVRSVKVVIDGETLELTGASREDQQRAMDAFIQRHQPD